MKKHRMRTSDTSRSRWWASPAQTPPIFLSARERINFFGVGDIPTTLPQWGQNRPSSAMVLPQALQYMGVSPNLRYGDGEENVPRSAISHWLLALG
jgi:hypothetical protein